MPTSARPGPLAGRGMGFVRNRTNPLSLPEGQTALPKGEPRSAAPAVRRRADVGIGPYDAKIYRVCRPAPGRLRHGEWEFVQNQTRRTDGADGGRPQIAAPSRSTLPSPCVPALCETIKPPRGGAVFLIRASDNPARKAGDSGQGPPCRLLPAPSCVYGWQSTDGKPKIPLP